MTPGEVRDALVLGLHRHTGRMVVLSDQTLPEAEMPYILYNPIQPYMPRGGVNIHAEPQGDAVITSRIENAEGTYSFTACSRNRDTPDGYVFGLDEAQALADAMHAWFVHIGYTELMTQGIAVIEVMNVQVRSQLEVDELDRRVGFDVRVRYPLTMTRKDPAVDPGGVNFKRM